MRLSSTSIVRRWRANRDGCTSAWAFRDRPAEERDRCRLARENRALAHLASDHPTRVVKFVTAIVRRDDVHQENVLRSLVQTCCFDFIRWKHTSIKRTFSQRLVYMS